MTGEIVQLLALNLGVTMACMLALWALSVRRGDPSFIDAWWPMGFVVIVWVSAVMTDGDPVRRWALVAVTTLWGIRLGGYLFWRWRRSGPDRRYVNMLRHVRGNPHLFTLTRVFLLQGALLWVVSLPIQLGQVYASPDGLRPLGVIGLVACAVGIALETTGDFQLVRFRADPSTTGQVLDTGLWRYTRHPNYFGDACTWWGLFFVAVVNPVTAIAVAGPLVMTFLLARWSGVGPLERGLRRHRPGYEDYIGRTSAFIPMPPRRRAGAAPASMGT